MEGLPWLGRLAVAIFLQSLFLPFYRAFVGYIPDGFWRFKVIDLSVLVLCFVVGISSVIRCWFVLMVSLSHPQMTE